MNVQYLSERLINRLHANAEANVSRYCSDGSWLGAFSGGKPYILDSKQIVDPPPILLHPTASDGKNDAENSRRVFTWLRALTPAIAMEERLWAHLTHITFAEYMNVRWPVEKASDIHRRYLFEGRTFSALSRNGIARLWWGGFLTHDPHRPAPFELANVLFLRQDVQVSLLERAIGKCTNVRVAVLEYLRDNAAALQASGKFGRKIQVLLREINLLGGVVVLDAYSPERLKEFIGRIGERLINDTA